MANFDAWVPEEYGGTVITKLQQMSAVERWGRHEPMSTDTKHVPRSGGVAFGVVPKGVAYGEDSSTNDEILLTAKKLGAIVRIADEDLKDASQVVNIIQTKQLDWARSTAVGFDNASLAVTAAANSTTIPYTSVYKSIRTTRGSEYTADDNYTASATGAGITYDELSTVFGLVEDSNYWSDPDMVVIAHPSFRGGLRGVLDTAGAPIFNESSSGDAGGGQAGPVQTLFGTPIAWSLGAKTHATATGSPTGNPLLIVCNRQYLVVGDRSAPEYLLAGADTGAAFATDEALLKMRVRRGFAVGHEYAFSVFEWAA